MLGSAGCNKMIRDAARFLELSGTKKMRQAVTTRTPSPDQISQGNWLVTFLDTIAGMNQDFFKYAPHSPVYILNANLHLYHGTPNTPKIVITNAKNFI